MTSAGKLSRRSFVKRLGAASAAIAAPTVLPSSVFGQNAPSNRITLGFIGVGKQGESHLRHLRNQEAFEIIGVCDCYKKFRDLGVKQVQDAYGNRKASGKWEGVESYNDFRDLLARGDLDAVLVATPDHWHAIPVVEAAKAGKDIYCEKPLSLTIEEADEMTKAVRRYGRVFQTGSQQRSSSNFRYACELVRNGYIGELKTVHANIGGTSVPCDLPAEPVPDGLDWDLWLGPAPWRPFNSVLRPPHNDSFPNWRGYRDYSGGSMTDWGAHHFDISQWGMGMDGHGPVEIIPPNGDDVKQLTYVYENGVRLYHGAAPDGTNGVLFTGTEGKIEVNRGHLRSWPDKLISIKLKPTDIHLYDSPNHHQDWLNSMRDRGRPICDVEVGASSVTVCHLGNIAYWLERPLKWDPVKHHFIGDEEANRMISRPRRGEWSLS